MAARTSWITWTGGIFGAIFIGTAVLMVPRLGGATVLALIVVDQMLGSNVDRCNSRAFQSLTMVHAKPDSRSPKRGRGLTCLLQQVFASQ
jgi:uncharacterized membrane protein YdcZ (DUF606 family)